MTVARCVQRNNVSTPTFSFHHQVDRDHFRIWVTGHSLGGALSTLGALKLDMEFKGPGDVSRIGGVYPMAAPRPGGKSFQSLYNSILGQITLITFYNNDMVAQVPFKTLGYAQVGKMLGICAGARLTPDGREQLVQGDLGQDVQCATALTQLNAANHFPSAIWDGLLRAMNKDTVQSPYGACALRAMSQCPGSRISNKLEVRCDLTISGTVLTCGGDATCAAYWKANSAAVAGTWCDMDAKEPWVCRAKSA